MAAIGALSLFPLVPGGIPAAAAQGTFINAQIIQVTINGATPVTVANTLVTAASIIIPTLKTVGGTVSPALPTIPTITPGTGFTIVGTASDSSIYNVLILG